MTFASWTRPLTDEEMKRYHGQLDWGLTPADHAGTTLRMTADRRIYTFEIPINMYQSMVQVMKPVAGFKKIIVRHI